MYNIYITEVINIVRFFKMYKHKVRKLTRRYNYMKLMRYFYYLW